MTNIVSIKGHAPENSIEPVAEIVAALTQAQKLASDGQIISFGYCAIDRAGYVHTFYHSTNQAFLMLGAAEHLKQRIHQGLESS
jgi:hypothetical protein